MVKNLWFIWFITINTCKPIEKGIQTPSNTSCKQQFGKAQKQYNLLTQPLKSVSFHVVLLSSTFRYYHSHFKVLSNTKLESSLIHISRRCEIAKKTTVWISCLESFGRKKKKNNNNNNNNKKNNVPTSNKLKLLVLAFLKFFSVEVSNWKLHTSLHQYGFGGNLPSWFDSHLHNCFQRVTALGL